MRTLRKLSMAVVLTLMLSTGALAGITETPPGPTPPPEPPSATETGGGGSAPSSDQHEPPPNDGVVAFALDLLQGLLSAF